MSPLAVLYVCACCLALVQTSPEFRRKKVRRIFEEYLDTNHDGKLDGVDMEAIGKMIVSIKGFQPNGKEHLVVMKFMQGIMGGVLEQAGAGVLGYVDVTQWVQVWEPAAGPQLWQKFYEDGMFWLLDIYNTGYITEEEYVQLFSIFGIPKEELVTAYKTMAQGKANINREDFAKIWWEYFWSEDPAAPGNYLPGRAPASQ